jgi:phosphate starvation-inducible PhoH-like protein
LNYKTIYQLKNPNNEIDILGPNNKYLKLIEDYFQEKILLRSGDIKIPEDSENKKILKVLFETLELILRTYHLSESDLLSIINNITLSNSEEIVDLYLRRKILLTTVNGKTIYPKTLTQKQYLSSLENNDINFAVGPAGTGKTFLGVLFAVTKLKAGDIRKIVLVRPVVEAGEKLGFLPGDLKEKIDPYLVPLYDALYDALGKDVVDKMIEKGIVEISPLAYMRGRTIENAIVILDEAQNSSMMQMKMFLTRLGFGSKMIITGDITQIDLPHQSSSGLIHAIKIFKGMSDLSITWFQPHDVMRHPLVQKILERYDDHENQSL